MNTRQPTRLQPMTTEQVASEGRLVNVCEFARKLRNGDARVAETMTTSDFAHFADLIDRGLAVGYTDNDIPVSYETIGARRDTISFETATDYRANRARRIARVAEKGQYLPRNPSEESFDFRTWKYGDQFDISWEAWLRDGRDLSMINDLYLDASAYGRDVRYTREWDFTEAYAANATFFTLARGNLLALALSEDNFGTALATLKNFTDPAGNVSPYIGPIYLVVPPALEGTARRILNSGIVVARGDTDTIIGNANVWQGAATLIVNPFLPAVDTTTGTTAWYLFCAPSIRPAVRYGFLRGYEQPEVFVRDSDARALMGGGDDPFAGSFLTDDISFKVRMTWGADTMDWRGALMSTP